MLVARVSAAASPTAVPGGYGSARTSVAPTSPPGAPELVPGAGIVGVVDSWLEVKVVQQMVGIVVVVVVCLHNTCTVVDD